MFSSLKVNQVQVWPPSLCFFAGCVLSTASCLSSSSSSSSYPRSPPSLSPSHRIMCLLTFSVRPSLVTDWTCHLQSERTELLSRSYWTGRYTYQPLTSLGNGLKYNKHTNCRGTSWSTLYCSMGTMTLDRASRTELLPQTRSLTSLLSATSSLWPMHSSFQRSLSSTASPSLSSSASDN